MDAIDALKATSEKLKMKIYHLRPNKMEVVLRMRGLWCYVDNTESGKDSQK